MDLILAVLSFGLSWMAPRLERPLTAQGTGFFRPPTAVSLLVVANRLRIVTTLAGLVNGTIGFLYV